MFESYDTSLALLSVELGCGLDFLDINSDSWYGEHTLAPR